MQANSLHLTDVCICARASEFLPDSVPGVEVMYASGKQTIHGQRMRGDKAHTFMLDEHERIVAVSIRSGWLIDQIGFVTTGKRRKIGPFGGRGGAAREVEKPATKQDGFLRYIGGSVGYSQGGTVLCGLRLYYGYYDYDACAE